MESGSYTTYKVSLLGDGGTGKTAWIKRWINDYFEKKYVATLGVEVHPMNFKTNHGNFKLDFWDTAGQEKFGGLRNGYYIESDAAIIFCDATSKLTIHNITNWIVDFKKACPNKPVMVIVNKVDIESWKANFSLINQLAQFLEIPVVMCSVKSKYNMGEDIETLLELITEDSDIKLIDNPSKTLTDSSTVPLASLTDILCV